MKKTIIVPANGFISWGGGVDYLRLQLRLLIKLCETYPETEIVLLLPELSAGGTCIMKLKNIIKHIIRRPVYNFSDLKNYLIKDLSISTYIKIMPYYQDKKIGNKSMREITNKLIENSRDPVVCFTSAPLRGLQCRQIGYIPDLQHKVFPNFFSEREIRNRNKQYISLLQKCDRIIVNARDVKDSLLEMYPPCAKEGTIFSAPFTPIADEKLLFDTPIKTDRVLPKKYFLISNQLWIHKDHKTAFAALRLLCDRGYNDIELVCTGKTEDYRHPSYFSEIKLYIEDLNLPDKIHFLGFMPKDEQIALLRKAIAMVQTTLFEGGPGGGAVWDAIAYGCPAIVSDIPVNREIPHPSVLFFKVGNPKDLAEKMAQLLENQPERPTMEALVSLREESLQTGAEFLRQVVG
jgi:glycosyltransferase involved in cell wall biosynthesis